MKVVKGFIFLLNCLLILASIGAFFAPHVPPSGNGIIAACGLIFPALLIANLLMVLFWFWVQPRFAIASILTLGLSLHFASNLYSVSGSKIKSEGLNTLYTGTFNMQFSKPIALLKGQAQKESEKKFNIFLKRKDYLDVLGVQECGWRSQQYIDNGMNFPYKHFITNNYSGIYSKHPIINKGIIGFEQNTSKCLWADIAIGKDTIRYYSAHLEPNRYDGKISIVLDEEIPLVLNEEKKENIDYDEEIPLVLSEKKKENIDYDEEIPLVLSEKKKENIDYGQLFGMVQHYEKFTNKRAIQAVLIRKHQLTSPYPSIIIGDFNDTPQTYTYSTIRKGLKDTFVESGFGLGETHGGKIPGLRIDYIFVDSILKVLHHRVHKNEFSDHYLVEGVLQY